MPGHLTFQQWVPFPVERVFEFFSNPENLPRIMPPASATRLISVNRVPPPGCANDKAAGVGTTMVTSFRVVPFLPFRAQWIARITEFEWNHFFADVQEKGPFKRWHHRHELTPETKDGVHGTCVTDVVDYDVGFGLVGDLASTLLIRHQIAQTFAIRQQILPRLLS